MAGVGDAWGTREEMLHPRDSHGRFRSKWKMSIAVVNKLMAFLGSYNPKTFGSDEEAGGYVQELGRSGRKGYGGNAALGKFLRGTPAVQAKLRSGDSSSPEVKAIDDSMTPLPDDLILTQITGPESWGLTPESIGQIEEYTGHLVADKGYTPTNIGTPLPHAGPAITMTIATPAGTRAAIPRSNGGREIILDRDQPLRITKVDPDGKGGFYVLAVAETKGAAGSKRTTAIGGKPPAPEPGLPQPQQAPGAPAAPGTPEAPGAVAPVAPAPGVLVPQKKVGRPAGPPPAVRNEGHVAEAIGGKPVPQGETPEPTPGAPEVPAEPIPQQPGLPDKPAPDPRSTFRGAFKKADLKSPSEGKRRQQFNEAYLGAATGKKTPQEAVDGLEHHITLNESILKSDKEDGTDSGPLPGDIQAQKDLAQLIKDHFGLEGAKSEKSPVKSVKSAKKAAPKKAAKGDLIPGKDREGFKALASQAPLKEKATPIPTKVQTEKRPEKFESPTAHLTQAERDKLVEEHKSGFKAFADRDAINAEIDKQVKQGERERKGAIRKEMRARIPSKPPSDEARQLAEKTNARVKAENDASDAAGKVVADKWLAAAGVKESDLSDLEKVGLKLISGDVASKKISEPEGRRRLKDSGQGNLSKIGANAPAKRAAAPKKAVGPLKDDLSNATIPQLREEAKKRGIKIPSAVRKKADIQAFILDVKPEGKKVDAPAVAKKSVPTWEELGKPKGPSPVGVPIGHEGGKYELLPGEPRRYRVTNEDGKDISDQVVTSPGRNQTAEDARTTLRMDALDRKQIKQAHDSGAVAVWDSIPGSWSYGNAEAKGFQEATAKQRHEIRVALSRWTAHKSSTKDTTRQAEPTVNAALRGSVPMDADVKADIAALDLALDLSRTKKSVTVHRGVTNGEHILPDNWETADLAGLEWSTKGYTPTTGNLEAAEAYVGHAKNRGFMMRIQLPKGSSAVAIRDALGGVDDEGEVILPRGLTFRVIKDNGPQGEFGLRQLDVEISETKPDLPSSTVKKATPSAPEKAAGTAKGKLTAARVAPGTRILVRKDVKGEWAPTATKTGATPITVTSKDASTAGGRRGGVTRSASAGWVITGKDDDGNEITVKPVGSSQTFWLHEKKEVKAPVAKKAVSPDAEVKVTKVSPAKTVTIPTEYSERKARAKTGRSALLSSPGRVSSSNTYPVISGPAYADMTPAERKKLARSISQYRSNFYSEINSRLRGEKPRNPHMDELIHDIDDAIGHSKLKSDVVVHRGIRRPEDVFGDKWSDQDVTGMEWQDPAYTSTSAAESVAVAMAGEADKLRQPSGVVMTILVPKGAHGIQGSPAKSGNGTEAELLLARGGKFRVVADHGVIHGHRRLDVEMLDSPLPARLEPSVQPKSPFAMPEKATGRKTATMPRSSADILKAMKADNTRAGALKEIESLTVPQLKQLAKDNDITVSGSKAHMQTAIVEWAVGRRFDSDDIMRAGSGNPYRKPPSTSIADTTTKVEKAFEKANPTPTGPKMSTAPLIENQWGVPGGTVNYHEDGYIGRTVGRLSEEDKHLDVDGGPLANELGMIATQGVRGSLTSQQVVDEIKDVAAKLPEGSAARRSVERLAEQLDAPARPPLDMPKSTPAALKHLMEDFSKIPLARRQGTGRPSEMDKLQAISERFASGEIRQTRLNDELMRGLYNNRHESEEGKFEIDRMVQKAIAALEKKMAADREARRPRPA